MKIDRFAIWFGKPIWKKKIDGVEYALGWIPAGGYVALPQMATMEAIEGKSESADQPLPPISALDKMIVAVAGPLFSFLLAFAFAVVVWGVGKPVNEDNNSTTIGWVDMDGPAWQAGLRPGDTITEIDGHPVKEFGSPEQDSITWRIITSEGTNIAVKYLRDGKEHLAYPVPRIRPTKWYERKALRQILDFLGSPGRHLRGRQQQPRGGGGLASRRQDRRVERPEDLQFHVRCRRPGSDEQQPRQADHADGAARPTSSLTGP